MVRFIKFTTALFVFYWVNMSLAQQTDYVDFKRASAMLGFNIDTLGVDGQVSYQFDVLKSVDSIFIDAVNMDIQVSSLRNQANDNALDFIQKYEENKLWIKHKFVADSKYILHLEYQAKPSKALYFVGWDSAAPNQIWTQGQGKYTSNWLPSFDDMNEKLIFDISITFDDSYTVLSNGLRSLKISLPGYKKWQFQMDKPMSSYLVALVIGKYNKHVDASESGVPLEMYYYPKDSLKVEPTYRYTKEIFDFLEQEIGVSYPWQDYKQVPVHDFLYSGMENTGLTVFSDMFVVDSIGFNDRNYVNVNAHELAHQWFGNLVTETSGTHHWLHEGFATYYALLAERHVFDDDYYYWRLYEYAQELFDQDNRGEGTSLLDPNSSSTTFYKRGAWALHALKELVGEGVFKMAVKDYLNKNQFGNVETADFIKEVEVLFGESLDDFVLIWLEASSFPYNEAMKSLENSTFIQEYMMVDCVPKNAKCDYYLLAPLSPEAKSKIVTQVPERIHAELFKDDLLVRQAIANSLVKIPDSLKVQYESLLKDPSYITQEAALYNLWLNFPEDRIRYLDEMSAGIGLSNKNMRQLWLVLALVTPNYKEPKKQEYYNELVSYTSKNFGFEVRQGAFSYLEAVNMFNPVALENLWDASSHINWRFRSFAKDLLDKLSNNPEYREQIELIKLKS